MDDTSVINFIFQKFYRQRNQAILSRVSTSRANMSHPDVIVQDLMNDTWIDNVTSYLLISTYHIAILLSLLVKVMNLVFFYNKFV